VSRRVLVVAAFVVACTRRPSVEPEPAPQSEPASQSEPQSEPAPTSEPTPVSEPAPTLEPTREELEARVRAVCEHINGVLASENPALRSPEHERDYMADCIEVTSIDHPDFHIRWTELWSCIEQTRTSKELAVCVEESESPAVLVGPEPRAVCIHMFDLMLTADPDTADSLGKAGLERSIERCSEDVGRRRGRYPVRYEREASCVLAAKTYAELDTCE
jgi:hypothetical protein